MQRKLKCVKHLVSKNEKNKNIEFYSTFPPAISNRLHANAAIEIKTNVTRENTWNKTRAAPHKKNELNYRQASQLETYKYFLYIDNYIYLNNSFLIFSTMNIEARGGDSYSRTKV